MSTPTRMDKATKEDLRAEIAELREVGRDQAPGATMRRRIHALLITAAAFLVLTVGTVVLTILWNTASVWEALYAGRWYLLMIVYCLTWWTTGKSPFRAIREGTYFAEAAEKAVLDVMREIPGELKARFPECLEAARTEEV